MKVIMVALGSLGDVHPYVGVGVGLRRRGHEVTVLANEAFADVVRQAGLGFHAIGTRRELDEAARRFTYRTVQLRQIAEVMESLAIHPARTIYAYIADAHDRGRTVAVASSFAFGARLAQEKLGVPLVSMDLQPAVYRSSYRAPRVPGLWMPDWAPPALKRAVWQVVDWIASPLAVPQVNRLRQELELPPIDRIWPDWLHSPLRVIGLFPPWFAPPQPDWPPQLRLTGFPLYHGPGPQELPERLEAFLADGPPPVAVTHGTEYRYGHRFFRVTRDACEQLNCRAVLLTRHAEQLPDRLPAGMLHVPYAPFHRLLPHTAAVVHHGGIGTCAEALAAGTPQLVMPISFDQADNASRLRELGVGAMLPRRRYQERTVARLLARLLHSDTVHRRCHQCAGRLAAEDPVTDTCEEIEAAALGQQ